MKDRDIKDRLNMPNPGSDEAIELGCTCPILDNEHGRGFPYPRKDGLDPNEYPSFYVAENCPLHDRGNTDD